YRFDQYRAACGKLKASIGRPLVLDRSEDEALYPVASILVVDDRPANLAAMQALLQPLGQRVVTASSGAEALRCAASEEFAVILMDVHMPMLDGFDTVARLRKE